MFARPHMAGLNDFLKRFVQKRASRKLSHAWYCSSLGGSEKTQVSEFVLIRGYTIKQLNTLIVTPII